MESLLAARVITIVESTQEILWSGGDATVVQLGDVMDRGDNEIGEAARGGGKVWRALDLAPTENCAAAVVQLGDVMDCGGKGRGEAGWGGGMGLARGRGRALEL